MNKSVVIDKATGSVISTMSWGGNPKNPPTVEVLTTQLSLTGDVVADAQPTDVYDSKLNKFYILDVSDAETAVSNAQLKLNELNLVLPTLQEETWTALGIDETKLSQDSQDKLKQKRALREIIAKKGVVA